MKVKENVEIINPFFTTQEMEKIYSDFINSDIYDYSEFIKKYENEKFYLMLLDLGENILNWYDFPENSNVLEISNDFGQISSLLLKKGLNVTRFEAKKIKKDFIEKRFKNSQKLKTKDLLELENEKEKYDYIILSNSLDYFEDYKEIFDTAQNLLNENGKIIVIFENPNSVNSYSLSDNKEGKLNILKNIEKFNIEKLDLYLKASNLKYRNTYYTFPNSYIPSIIYEENFFKNNVKQVSYPSIINDTDIIIANENELINQIISQNPSIIRDFVNSYIVEISKEEIKNKSLMISFNNYRKEEFELITMLKDNKVYKIPRSKAAKNHIKNMKEGIEYLKKIDKSFIDDVENDVVYSKFIKDYETFDNIIFKEYQKNKDLEKISKMYKESYKVLEKNLLNFNEIQKNELLNEIPEEVLRKMKFLKTCPWDMVAKNCFLINNEYLYFDQEWFEESLPLEFLIYRSVINSYDLVRNIDVHELLKILEIDEYFEYFEKVNEKLRDKILNKTVFKLYENKNMKIDNLLYTLVELEVCKKNLKDTNENNLKQDEYIKYLEGRLRKFTFPRLRRVVKKILGRTTIQADPYLMWRKENLPSKWELKIEKNTKFKINPKISIVVPLYNTKEKFFKELVEALKNQTYSNWELCLADRK